MNELHLRRLASDEWRAVLRDRTLPFTFADVTMADLGDDVLEIGPGPGLTTDLLVPSIPSLTALELDPALAASLRARVGSSVTVVEGDATDMPFDDGRFSGVVSFTMLHHVPTVDAQDRLFAETCRVLRPGGLFVVNDGVPGEQFAAMHEGDVYNPVDPDALAGRLQRAGFDDVHVRANAYAFAAHARAPRAGLLTAQRFVGFVATTDLGRAEAFYGGVLGLRVVNRDGFAVELDAAGTRLRLARVDHVVEPVGTVAGWVVDDVHAAVRTLAAAGVPTERFPGMDQDNDGVWPVPGGGAVAWFRDPDGNRLSLTRPA